MRRLIPLPLVRPVYTCEPVLRSQYVMYRWCSARVNETYKRRRSSSISSPVAFPGIYSSSAAATITAVAVSPFALCMVRILIPSPDGPSYPACSSAVCIAMSASVSEFTGGFSNIFWIFDTASARCSALLIIKRAAYSTILIVSSEDSLYPSMSCSRVSTLSIAVTRRPFILEGIRSRSLWTRMTD